MNTSLASGKNIGLWGAVALVAVFPLLVQIPYYQNIATMAMFYIALAVAFDLVVGRVGALSLAQPVFLAIGAYTAAILNSQFQTGFLLEAAVAAGIAVVSAILIGIPAFRLSTHAFAMGTLAIAVSAGLVANNWIDVTGGPMCTVGVGPLYFEPFGPGSGLQGPAQIYYVAFGIAILTVATVWWISRRRVGLGLTAVRDDDLLASARGLWPTELRIGAFAISAALTALVGVVMAHLQTVVCPSIVDMNYTIVLLIMVFIGGRGSLRGVVTAAVVFTVLPQLLQMADQWRMVIYSMLLLVIVLVLPDGFERLFQLGTPKKKRALDNRSKLQPTSSQKLEKNNDVDA